MKIIKIALPGSILKSGFWLYVWRVKTAHGKEVLYIGRTGDSSSANAAPPYRRLGQHLGMVKASNALRTHLSSRKIISESCKAFEFFAYGPLYKKQSSMKKHVPIRDRVAALEKALADSLRNAGYDVLNRVNCKKPLNPMLWRRVHKAFSTNFPRMKPIRLDQ